MNCRVWLLRNLAVLGIALAVLLIALALSGLLRVGGDEAGAAAVFGVVLVAAVVVAITLLIQIVLLTLDALARQPSVAVKPPSHTD